LDNGGRMDIYVINKIESNLVFLEVKWLGRAISPSGDGIGTVMTQTDLVPKAFNQVVDYIRQLTTQRHDVRKGYLVVFDARDGNLPDIGDGMKDEMWSDENKPYRYKFRKIQDFKVVNGYPR